MEDLACLASILNQLKAYDPLGVYQLETVTKRMVLAHKEVDVTYMKAAHIIPSMSIEYWKKNPMKIASVDATFGRTVLGGTFNTVNGIDGNMQRLTMMLSIVPVENKENWLRTFELSMQHLFDDEISMVISDRDKGLIAAEEILPHAVHARCAVHIARNIGLGSGEGLRDVTALAKAPTRSKFEAILSAVSEKYQGKNVVEKLRDLVPVFCTHSLLDRYGKDHQYAFVTNYGITSNNASEQENSGLRTVRDLPYSQAVVAFMERLQKQFHVRRQQTYRWLSEGNLVVPHAVERAVEESKKLTRARFVVRLTSWLPSPRHVCTFKVFKDLITDQSVTATQLTILFRPTALLWQQRIVCPCCEYIATGIPCPHASYIISHCAATRSIVGSQINEIIDDELKAFMCDLKSIVWYAPVFHTEVIKAMYEVDVSILPSWTDAITLSQNNFLMPFGVPRKPGSRKQSLQNDEIVNRENEDFGEIHSRSIDDLHAHLTMTYLESLSENERPHRCSLCGLVGHRASTCKQSDVGYALIHSKLFQKYVTNH